MSHDERDGRTERQLQGRLRQAAEDMATAEGISLNEAVGRITADLTSTDGPTQVYGSTVDFAQVIDQPPTEAPIPGIGERPDVKRSLIDPPPLSEHRTQATDRAGGPTGWVEQELTGDGSGVPLPPIDVPVGGQGWTVEPVDGFYQPPIWKRAFWRATGIVRRRRQGFGHWLVSLAIRLVGEGPGELQGGKVALLGRMGAELGLANEAEWNHLTTEILSGRYVPVTADVRALVHDRYGRAWRGDWVKAEVERQGSHGLKIAAPIADVIAALPLIPDTDPDSPNRYLEIDERHDRLSYQYRTKDRADEAVVHNHLSLLSEVTLKLKR